MSFDKIFNIFNSFFKKSEVPEPPNVKPPVEENTESENKWFLKVPARNSSAKTGSEFVQANLNISGKEREENIVKEINSGNIPSFLKNLVGVSISNSNGRLTYYVMPDYLCIGSDSDYLRIPMSPLSAQTIADLYDCTLPTRKMVNDIWKYSKIKLLPQPIPPDSKMSSTQRYSDHNKLINKSLAGKSQEALISGHKKDVVLTNRLYPGNPSKRVAIYGWIQSGGKPIQGLNPSSHDWNYADYSHGIRLISNEVLFNDEVIDIKDIFKDKTLSSFISDEGILNFVRY